MYFDSDVASYSFCNSINEFSLDNVQRNDNYQWKEDERKVQRVE